MFGRVVSIETFRQDQAAHTSTCGDFEEDLVILELSDGIRLVEDKLLVPGLIHSSEHSRRYHLNFELL